MTNVFDFIRSIFSGTVSTRCAIHHSQHFRSSAHFHFDCLAALGAVHSYSCHFRKVLDSCYNCSLVLFRCSRSGTDINASLYRKSAPDIIVFMDNHSSIYHYCGILLNHWKDYDDIRKPASISPAGLFLSCVMACMPPTDCFYLSSLCVRSGKACKHPRN